MLVYIVVSGIIIACCVVLDLFIYLLRYIYIYIYIYMTRLVYWQAYILPLFYVFIYFKKILIHPKIQIKSHNKHNPNFNF